MRFIATRDNLTSAIKAVGGVIPSRTTLPILSNVLIEAEGEVVEISGTDLDVAATIKMPADVQEEGAIAIPARKLYALVKNLPEAPVTVERVDDKDTARLTAGSSVYDFYGMPIEEAPDFPKVSYESAWKVEADLLRNINHLTAFCVSTDESRPILHAVCWKLQEDGMMMVAANGHRMAEVQIDGAPEGAPLAELLVPPKALAMAAALFPDDDEVEVGHTGNHIGFRTEQAEVLARLIEGPFPAHQQAYPTESSLKHRAVVDRFAFQRSLARANVIASDQTHRCVLYFADGGVRVNAETPDLGKGDDQLAVEVSEPITISFDAVYLSEIMDRIASDDAVFRMAGPERAAIIAPAEQNGMRLRYLLMPLRLLE